MEKRKYVLFWHHILYFTYAKSAYEKLLLIPIILFCITAHTQLEIGSKLVGIQTNIMEGDIYASSLSLHIGKYANESYYGLNLVPTIGWARERNWVVGGQITPGFLRNKNSLSGYESIHTYYDLGIAPFTRVYIDVTKNKKWKVFGMASAEIANSQTRSSING